jgi:multicomponent Na+:H+ antiporter subunit E
MQYGRHLIILAILGLVWCLLSGHYTALLLGFGVFSCVVSVWLYHRVVEGKLQWITLVSPLEHVRYIFWLVIEICKSNIDVIRAIFNPSRIEPQFFEVDTGDLDEIGKVVYANSITLTPGTVTTRLRGNKIQAHGLTLASKEALQGNEMRDRVARLNPVSDDSDNPGAD